MHPDQDHWHHPPGHSYPCWEGKNSRLLIPPTCTFRIKFFRPQEKIEGEELRRRTVRKAINQCKWMTVERKLWEKMCKDFLLMKMGGYWDLICNTAACKKMSLLQGPEPFLGSRVLELNSCCVKQGCTVDCLLTAWEWLRTISCSRPFCSC